MTIIPIKELEEELSLSKHNSQSASGPLIITTKMLTPPFFLCCLIYALLVVNNALANPNMLKLPLIHQHSPQSPFFQSNLSTEERIRRSITQSDTRADFLTSSPSLAPRIKLTSQHHVYMVQICLGTFSSSEPPCKKYYLELDTGSSLTWLQCEGCKVCYHQVPQLYPAKKSKSYRRGLFSAKPYQVEKFFVLGRYFWGLAKTMTLSVFMGLQNWDTIFMSLQN